MEFINLGWQELTSNDIIAGNGRFLKDYMFIMWLYLPYISQHIQNDVMSQWAS